eukprot:835616_1
MGGYETKHQLLSFDTQTFAFSDHGEYNLSYSSNMFSWSTPSYYSQFADVLYVLTAYGLLHSIKMETSVIESDDLTPNTWRNNACLVAFHLQDDYVVIAGGTDQTYSDVIAILDLTNWEWFWSGKIPYTAIVGHSCNVVDQTIYIIGGRTGDTVYDSIQTLCISDTSNLASETWVELTDKLSTSKWGHNSIVYGSDIIVIGGYGGVDKYVLGYYAYNVDVINTLTGEISTGGPLAFMERGGASIIAYPHIFEFGGTDDDNREGNTLKTWQFLTLDNNVSLGDINHYMQPVNIYPSTTNLRNKTVGVRSSIQGTDYHIDYFAKFKVLKGDCFKPKISIWYQDTDFDDTVESKFLHIYYDNNFITNCGTNDSSYQYRHCLIDYVVSPNVIAQNTFFTVQLQKGKDSSVPTNCSYSLSADVTLTCDLPTTSPTLAPTTSPSAATYHPTLSPTSGPTLEPTNYPTFETIDPTGAPTDSPTSNPSGSPTQPPSDAPSATPTQPPTNAPTFSPTMNPSESPTQPPTKSPTTDPTDAPTMAPSVAPSISPTNVPSLMPSSSPTLSPSALPTLSPSLMPSSSPTLSPTNAPTNAPSFTPTFTPTFSPTSVPTLAPTSAPTLTPTFYPTLVPTSVPTLAPSLVPSFAPTAAPSRYPTESPTIAPSNIPSFNPSMIPTLAPSKAPSIAPTPAPSMSPLRAPTMNPSQYPTNPPTYSPSNAPSFSPLTVGELVSFHVDKKSDGVSTKWIIYGLFGAIPVLLILIALITKQCTTAQGGDVDNQQYLPIFLYFVQLFDLYSDAIFALQLYQYYSFAQFSKYNVSPQDVSTFFMLFVLSMSFTVLPYIANFASSVSIIASIVNNPIISDYTKDYFKNSTSLYSGGVLLSGGSFYTLTLLNSNFLGLDQLSAGLSKMQLQKFAKHKIYLTTCLENTPQLCIQAYFIWRLNLVTNIVIMSLISSVFNILLSILNTLIRQTTYRGQYEYPFKVNLSVSSTKPNIANTDPYLHVGRRQKLAEELKHLSESSDMQFALDFEILSFSKITNTLYGVAICRSQTDENTIKQVLVNNIQDAVNSAFGRGLYAELKDICAVPSDVIYMNGALLLGEWGLGEYWNIFTQFGWDDVTQWTQLIALESELNKIFQSKTGYKHRFTTNVNRFIEKNEPIELQSMPSGTTANTTGVDENDDTKTISTVGNAERGRDDSSSSMDIHEMEVLLDEMYDEIADE